jgi:hypothetical protein
MKMKINQYQQLMKNKKHYNKVKLTLIYKKKIRYKRKTKMGNNKMTTLFLLPRNYPLK